MPRKPLTPSELGSKLDSLGWLKRKPVLTKAQVDDQPKALRRNAKLGSRRGRRGRPDKSLRQLIEAGQASQQKLISEVGKERYARMTQKYMAGQSKVTSMS